MKRRKKWPENEWKNKNNCPTERANRRLSVRLELRGNESVLL